MTAAVFLFIIALLTIIGPGLNDFAPEVIDLVNRNHGPDALHWFGTDQLGRDLFTRVWMGGRVSIIIGILGSLTVTAVGCIYGGIASYFGGAVDMVLMRIAEIMDSVPYLLVVIIISVVLNSTAIPVLLFAMTVTAWCSTARLVRSQMLQINSMEFIMAARIMSVPPLRIVLRHLIPNSLSVIIVSLTFRIPGFIFSEAFLSYVGLGVRPPATSWGVLCSTAAGTLQFYPYQMFFPAFCIALTMLCFTLIGDGLRDALDPKLRR
jgi:oligopeptide transport system permease protein